MIYWRIFSESFQFALHALAVNKLRTILSLLGITIGIFTIILVFTVVDSLERNIRESVSELGSDVVYVQKMPWSAGAEGYAWWKYFQRPEARYWEYEQLKPRLRTASTLAFAFAVSKTVKYGKNSVDMATVMPVSHEYYDVWSYDIVAGRYFSPAESASGRPVAVIGMDIAEALFGSESPLGREIKLMGRKVRVIGVFARQGSNLVGQNVDEMLWVPVKFAGQLVNINDQQGAFVMAVAAPGVELAALKDELRGAMRSIRKLKPRAEDNFALNEISLLTAGLESVFSILSITGLVIGGFSILVGGFGIANIMFVTVRERTNQIGIQKSLGAKNYFILTQFLLEAILLCVLGGAAGLVLVWGSVELLSWALDFSIILSLHNIIQGMSISVVIGLVAGYVPAYSASRLNPVDAIRAGG